MNQRSEPFDLGPPSLPWRLTLALSIGLHLFGFLLIVGVPRLMPRPGIAPVYVVDLVSLPGGPPAASPPPAGAAPVLPPPAPRKEEKAIKIPERGAKKPEPKKTPEPNRTPEARTPPPKPSETKSRAAARATPPPAEHPGAASQAPGAPGGAGTAGGGYGGSGVEQTDVLNFYGALVKRNIENAWKKPLYPSTETSRRAFTTQVRVIVTSSGRVSRVEIVAPSGYEAMDQSVLDAVHEAIFPPFPATLSSPVLVLPIEIVLTPD